MANPRQRLADALRDLLQRSGRDRGWLASNTSRSYQAICTYLDGTHTPPPHVLDEILDALDATHAERSGIQTLRDEQVRLRRLAALTPASGWYLRQLRVHLELIPPGQVIEERRIHALRDLTEIVNWVDYPFNPGTRPLRSQVQVLSGGTLVRQDTPFPGRHRIITVPPQPLRAGQEHTYRLQRTIPARMRPQYLLIPETRCDKLEISIHFDPIRMPAWIRKVDGEPQEQVNAAYATATPPPRSRLLKPDCHGHIQREFTLLQLRLCYGIQWSP